jgi:hypothetical protein
MGELSNLKAVHILIAIYIVYRLLKKVIISYLVTFV